MKREILFRGKRIDNSEWITGFYGWSMGEDYITEIHCVMPSLTDPGGEYSEITKNVDPETVGQFFFQSGGSKIFEDDFVEFDLVKIDESMPEVKRLSGVVSFKDGRLSIGYYKAEYCKNIKLLGNIHDNPELINTANHD